MRMARRKRYKCLEIFAMCTAVGEGVAAAPHIPDCLVARLHQNETGTGLYDVSERPAGMPGRESLRNFSILSTKFETVGGLCTGPCHSCNTPRESSICACGKGVFFIACQFPWAKVAERRRGASPSRPALEAQRVFGFLGGSRGDKGTFQGRRLRPKTEPSHRK
jgi:hypothetical protein